MADGTYTGAPLTRAEVAAQDAQRRRPLTEVPFDEYQSAIFWRVFWAIIAAHTVMGVLAGLVWAVVASGQ